MKRILLIPIVTLFLLVMPSCTADLDESDYTYAITVDNFYNTPSEANAGVMAVLDAMRSSYDANWFTLLEVNTEYVYGKGVYTAYDTYKGFVNSSQETRSEVNWSNIYRSILFCNTGINKIPKGNKMSDAEKNAYVAELKFLRAYNYLNLVKHWGGVIMRTDENLEQWDLPKSSKEEIYAFIEKDVIFAIDNLPQVSRIGGTPNQLGAKSLYAEVAMYLKKYDLALKLSSEVVQSGVYSLIPVTSSLDFDKVFGFDLPTTTEEIFYIKTSRTDNRTWSYLSYTSHPKYKINGELMLNGFGYFTHYTDLKNELIKTWDKNDFRRDRNVGFYVFGADTYGDGTCLLTKYRDPNASGGGANVNIPLIRYTDVLITYSEALARTTGDYKEAIEVLNKIKRRAYGKNVHIADSFIDYDYNNVKTMDEYLNVLLKEEMYERFNEGKHWDFMVRLGKAQERIGKYKNLKGETISIEEKHYLWKIPDTEFNYNKSLDQRTDQNPGY
ncbi:RagB/SusD family nutrient uptake outer membrane protein [Myroides odoratimimus]|uniref:RagB/SusD family nutrient uptake outer membrane protein n=1 Tax=Myroides odoratimimus TaxID=76832 RepID=UPI0025788B54|nr:RagB/SusD family nutrient uptake outer membrane protein [Myroides odoratimimus]MDM1521158.1 RagB/SusD family nutrient uptake outer membrane protein [Myroides odoratimimus]MDX4974529.1 RagB/SusD family nutrient uptake outer membrane protein [Myroides odoratimimus]